MSSTRPVGGFLAEVAWETGYTLARCPAILWGLQRRRRGFYDLITQRLLSAEGGPRARLGARLRDVAFQRDLGHVPTVETAQRLLQWPKPVPSSQLLRYANVVLEAGGLERQLVERIGLGRLQTIGSCSPPIALAVRDCGGQLDPAGKSLVRLQRSQPTWRKQFLEELRQSLGSVCVVGNSDRLRGSGQGSVIDAHNTVVRFNRCSTVRLPVQDVGSRLDVWVVNPSLNLEKPPGSALPRWVVLSGADPRYQLRQWGLVVEWLSKGSRVLTIPLSVWQSLVTVTQAPPSAGLLVLSWLVDNLAPKQAVHSFGFDTEREDVRWKGQCRHSWPAEARLLEKLRSKGLMPYEAGVSVPPTLSPR